MGKWYFKTQIRNKQARWTGEETKIEEGIYLKTAIGYLDNWKDIRINDQLYYAHADFWLRLKLGQSRLKVKTPMWLIKLKWHWNNFKQRESTALEEESMLPVFWPFIEESRVDSFLKCTYI